MTRKNILSGIVTVASVIVILAIGGLAVFLAIRPDANSLGITGGHHGRFEQRFSDGEFEQAGHHPGKGEFSLLRGLGGVFGTVFSIGVIVLAVVGGQSLYKRFVSQPGNRGGPPSENIPVSPDSPMPEAKLESKEPRALNPEPEMTSVEP